MANLQQIIDAGGSQTLLLVSAADLREFAIAVVQEAKEKMQKQQEPDNDELLTTRQACETFKISTATLWRWVKAGLLHPRKAGVKNLFSKAEIEKVIQL